MFFYKNLPDYKPLAQCLLGCLRAAHNLPLIFRPFPWKACICILWRTIPFCLPVCRDFYIFPTADIISIFEKFRIPFVRGFYPLKFPCPIQRLIVWRRFMLFLNSGLFALSALSNPTKLVWASSLFT